MTRFAWVAARAARAITPSSTATARQVRAVAIQPVRTAGAAAAVTIRDGGLESGNGEDDKKSMLKIEISDPTAILRALATRYESSTRIIMEYVDNSLDRYSWPPVLQVAHPPVLEHVTVLHSQRDALCLRPFCNVTYHHHHRDLLARQRAPNHL